MLSIPGFGIGENGRDLEIRDPRIAIASCYQVDRWTISVYNQHQGQLSFPSLNRVAICIKVAHVQLCWVAGNAVWFHIAVGALQLWDVLTTIKSYAHF